MYIHIYMCIYMHMYIFMSIYSCPYSPNVKPFDESSFLDGYCSTVQGLLDWFEVDWGFSELLFIQINLCVTCVFILYSPLSLSSCPFLDILHCLPRAVGVPLESALNLVGCMSSCGTHAPFDESSIFIWINNYTRTRTLTHTYLSIYIYVFLYTQIAIWGGYDS